MKQGKVGLTGAGPGSSGLLTRRGEEVIEKADLIVYDALVGEEILSMLPEKTEKISVGKRAGKHSTEPMPHNPSDLPHPFADVPL